ncbi:hypothetical protein MK280_04350 [Myxococcota bacterium]|nr:hypothetical protein [Myxococcota bacterium]
MREEQALRLFLAWMGELGLIEGGRPNSSGDEQGSGVDPGRRFSCFGYGESRAEIFRSVDGRGQGRIGLGKKCFASFRMLTRVGAEQRFGIDAPPDPVGNRLVLSNSPYEDVLEISVVGSMISWMNGSRMADRFGFT